MTHHVITLMTHGARISVDRGFLVCHYPDKTQNRVAIADVRAIILTTPKIGFSAEAISRLLEQDSIILHCNNHYRAIGWTIALERVIKKTVFQNQIENNQTFNQSIWDLILYQKISNQIFLLDAINAKHSLHKHLEKDMKLDESNIARWYWEYFFSNLGHKQNREKQNAESFENKALNYGYAVIASLIHRSILIHGLLPDLGVQHKFRYRSTPLVYDLIEPYRPFIDYMLYIWSKISLEYKKTDEQIQWRAWINYLMNSLKNCRIKKPFEKHSHKLIDTIDISVASIASVFRDYKLENIKQLIWLPEFKDHYWHNQDEEQI